MCGGGCYMMYKHNLICGAVITIIINISWLVLHMHFFMGCLINSTVQYLSVNYLIALLSKNVFFLLFLENSSNE